MTFVIYRLETGPDGPTIKEAVVVARKAANLCNKNYCNSVHLRL